MVSPKGLRDKTNSPWEGEELGPLTWCGFCARRGCYDPDLVDPHGMFEDIIFDIFDNLKGLPRY